MAAVGVEVWGRSVHPICRCWYFAAVMRSARDFFPSPADHVIWVLLSNKIAQCQSFLTVIAISGEYGELVHKKKLVWPSQRQGKCMQIATARGIARSPLAGRSKTPHPWTNRGTLLSAQRTASPTAW